MPATALVHPDRDRFLSIEEYKRIQEFPDDWKLAGDLTCQYRQIGNAVPIGLARAIGRLLLARMDNEPCDYKKYVDFPYSRYKNTDEVSWIRRFSLNPDVWI